MLKEKLSNTETIWQKKISKAIKKSNKQLSKQSRVERFLQIKTIICKTLPKKKNIEFQKSANKKN